MLAVGPHRDDASVVAAGEQRLAVADRRQHGRVGMGDDALLLAGLAEQHDAVAERERRRVAEKAGGDDMRAGVEQLRVLRQRRVGSIRSWLAVIRPIGSGEGR